ncbi:MAG: hypothetical protein E2581_08780 [Pseudomonas sp.]|uniref:hypothetical protein n=1 Tax=Pseudomonas sp. TaxID=306 RepID=UPI001DD51C87|nr:hypothetical protein [Pseudomonas sp.]MPS98581.1 hypothetical protein [Pseudomonas sp.]
MAEPAVRLPMPVAYCDPAFRACLLGAIEEPELVSEFNRLYGATLGARTTAIEQMVDKATGMRGFAKFVHDSVYTRLSDEAIHSLRAGALAAAH